MVLRDALAESAWGAARVLATDISARVLARARAGVYADDVVADVAPALAKRHFARAPGGGGRSPPGCARPCSSRRSTSWGRGRCAGRSTRSSAGT
jgi:hypothetical protein